MKNLIYSMLLIILGTFGTWLDMAVAEEVTRLTFKQTLENIDGTPCTECTGVRLYARVSRATYYSLPYSRDYLDTELSEIRFDSLGLEKSGYDGPIYFTTTAITPHLESDKTHDAYVMKEGNKFTRIPGEPPMVPCGFGSQ